MTWIALLALFFSAWYLLPHAVKSWQIERLRERCRAERLIVLTYDDGPGMRVTSKVVSELRGFGATATFFMQGCKIDTLRASAALVFSDGHEVGCHSYRHLHAWKHDPISIFLDIRRGLRSARNLSECRLFRAPYGKLTLASLVQVWLEGCRQAWWTVDSTDTWARPRGVEDVLHVVRAQGGGVILMHDHDRPTKPGHEQFVLDLTRGLLDLAENEGFRICKLGEVIHK